MQILKMNTLRSITTLTIAVLGVGALSLPLQAATVLVTASSAKGRPAGGGTLNTTVTEEGLKLKDGNDISWNWSLLSRSEKDIDIDPDAAKDETGTVTEKKFDFTDAGTPKPRNFTGFEAEAKTKWSSIEAEGRGSSRRSIGNTLKVKAEIAIKGEISVPKIGEKMVDAEYEGQASVSDPFYLTPNDIKASGLEIGNFDLFLPFSLEAFSTTDTTDAYFSYFVETADGRTSIFDLVAGPLVSSKVSYDLESVYYLLDDIDDEPDFLDDKPLDMMSFASEIQSKLDSGGTIGPGFSLGVLLAGLNLDGKFLPNGAAVAHGFEGGTGAHKFEIGYTATIPLPAGFWLFASALGLSAGVARTMRKSS